MERVVWRAIGDLKPFPGNPRRHPESQIAGLMKSIRKVWTNPILIDESGMILAGHGRLEAAKHLDPADDLSGVPLDAPAVSKLGDRWELGRHHLMCGDALRGDDYRRLLGGEVAQMVITDPPFNVKIHGHAMGRGRIRHREFKVALGEMSESEFTAFLEQFTRSAVRHSQDGSIHFVFMDWRHLPELLAAARPIYSEWKNLLVWAKTNAGQGSFYRSQHELVAVFKNGTAAHINNFGLGGQGRYRTNVLLDYPGVNSFHPARQGELELHPTAKPIALIADLIRDCSRRNGLILDPFGGSGTTVLAPERTGRIARLIELDPLYVDVAIRRWEQVTGIQARHIETGPRSARRARASRPPPSQRCAQRGKSRCWSARSLDRARCRRPWPPARRSPRAFRSAQQARSATHRH
jgi:DNA modification methylase